MMELHLLKYRPAHKRWYLFNIGVLEEYRGSGIDSQLLDYGTERIGDYPPTSRRQPMTVHASTSATDSTLLGRYTVSSLTHTPSTWSTPAPLDRDCSV